MAQIKNSEIGIEIVLAEQDPKAVNPCLLAAVQQPLNLILASALARQSNMLSGDPALAVDGKRLRAHRLC
jgi:hypothetical protein